MKEIRNRMEESPMTMFTVHVPGFPDPAIVKTDKDHPLQFFAKMRKEHGLQRGRRVFGVLKDASKVVEVCTLNETADTGIFQTKIARAGPRGETAECIPFIAFDKKDAAVPDSRVLQEFNLLVEPL
jgi:hypothetical protein